MQVANNNTARESAITSVFGIMVLVICLLLLLGTVVGQIVDIRSHYEILNVTLDADQQTIKSSYRSLALITHPDKLLKSLMSEEEIAEAQALFIRVQEAYDVLSDPFLRTQYDQRSQGSSPDVLHIKTFDEFGDGRYTKTPRLQKDALFSLFITSHRFKLHFITRFERPPVQELRINLDVTVRDVLHGLDMTHRFFRRSICTDCNGTGGLHGDCDLCELCEGTGVARHISSSGCCHSHTEGEGEESELDSSRKRKCNSKKAKCQFQQMTTATCAACGGRGCIYKRKCTSCNGSGLKLVPEQLILLLPIGFKNHRELIIENGGHEDFDGRRGPVIVRAAYALSPGWLRDDVTGDLIQQRVESLDRLMCLLSPLPSSSPSTENEESGHTNPSRKADDCPNEMRNTTVELPTGEVVNIEVPK